MKKYVIFFSIFAVIIALAMQSCGTSKKATLKPVVLSEKAMTEYSSLEKNILDIQFFINTNSGVELKKPVGEEDQVVNGNLTVDNKYLIVNNLTKV